MPVQRIDQLGSIGLNTDMSVASLPEQAWTFCQHVMPRDGKAVRAWDTQTLFSIAIEPVFHFNYRDVSNNQYLIVGDGKSVWAYRVDTGVGEDITPSSISNPITSNKISFCSHNGVLCYSTFQHGIFYWPGTGNKLESFPSVDDGAGGNLGWRYDLNWRCNALASYKYQLVAVGMSEDNNYYPHKLRWSSSAAEGEIPTIWAPKVSNDAGDDLIGDTSGPLINAVLVRDALWLIKTDSVHSLNWIGGQYIMQSRRLEGIFDIASREAAIEVAGTLMVLSGRDFYQYDGARLQSLIANKVRDRFKEMFSARGFDTGKLFSDRYIEQVFVLGDPVDDKRYRSAMVYDLSTQSWGHMFIQNAYGFESILEDTPTQGASPQVVAFLSNDSRNNFWVAKLVQGAQGGYTSILERKGIPVLGAPGLAMVREVWPEVKGTADLDITVYAQNTLDGPVTSDGPYRVESQSTPQVAPRLTGRFIGYRVSSASSGNWELDNMTYRYEPAGEH